MVSDLLLCSGFKQFLQKKFILHQRCFSPCTEYSETASRFYSNSAFPDYTSIGGIIFLRYMSKFAYTKNSTCISFTTVPLNSDN